LELVAARLPNTSFQQFPELTRLALAVHSGAPDAATLADTPEGDAGFSTTTAAEQRTAQGLAWLQAGAIGRAISACEAAWATTKVGETKGSAAASAVALGLVYVAAGRPDEALHTCDQVAEDLVTYLDHIQDSLVRGFANLQLGDEAASDAAFARAVQIADDTDSPLDQGLVRLARAVAGKALQRAGADEAHAEATGILTTIGLPATGWERAYTLAAAGGKGE
jgi:tetratricopeptide (TPR) repeat protein